MKPPMTDEEWLHWKDVVKCDWLHCAGGMGLAGNGCCEFLVEELEKWIENGKTKASS